MSLKRNVVANYLGQGWRAVMSFAFVPMYIKYLGVEPYGLIGIFAILQASLGLLDMGIRPALAREMARFTGGAHDAQSIRDLLRSIEIIVVAIASTAALVIGGASGWLASNWLSTTSLPQEAVARAFTAMGTVAALALIESIYVNSIAGLNRQVSQNVITSIMASARAFGAVGVLVWVSPTIEAFFAWQSLISLITVLLFASIVYRTLPPAPRPARFSRTALQSIQRFAGETLTITILGLLLTQTDKILLSRLLTLEEFAHYTLAGVVANALSLFVGPVSAAFYPRFTELATHGDATALSTAYHQGAQLVTVLMGAAAAVLMLFSDRVLLLWTSDPLLTQQTAPVMAVLALGTLFNGLMHLPFYMQLAHGWTTLVIASAIIAVGIIIPAILWIVPKYGAMGAAWIWVTLNTGNLVFSIHFLHRRLLPSEKWRWYRQDIFIPLAAATATAGLCRWILPQNLGKLGEFAVLLLAASFTLTSAGLAAPLTRRQLAKYLPRPFKLVSARITE